MKTLTRLKAEPIGKIFKDCVVPRNNGSYLVVSAPGITGTRVVFFDLAKLEEYRAEITGFVSQLPTEFKTTTGASFNGTNRSYRGDIWCRDEADREKLVQLGIALGIIELIEPRERWAYLPRQRPSIRVIQR
jgi:hypothetical protein